MSEDSTTTVAGRKSPRGESGQALVEFVIALPLLVLMIFAVIEFGLLYSHHITLTDATRVGARTAAVSRRTCPGNTEQAVRDSASTLDQSALEVEISPCPWSSGGQVEVSATYEDSIDLIGFDVGVTLSSTTKERVE